MQSGLLRAFSASALPPLLCFSWLSLSACGGVADRSDGADGAQASSRQETVSKGHGPKTGEELFRTAFAHTNGRSCASCHVLEEHAVLRPSHVAELLLSDPTDPLFNRIDADDPDAAEPSYEHLKKGLVRVVLTLPANMDLIDFDGNVVTPPDRSYAVWRAVPTVENSAITAPYQYDGRRATLQAQAQGAITAHSQGPLVKPSELDAIAEFQKG
ncbi:MAG TPA: hypothetical protein VGJ91_13825, partial [Polyangiaceae bacterium]